MAYFESAFDVLYLVSVIAISAIVLYRGIKTKKKAIIIFGCMGLLLGFGDAFHLIPRILAHLTTGFDDYQTALGVGKLITGITMTIFYYLIYQYYVLVTGKKNDSIHLTVLLLMLARFILLALPGNDWFNNGTSLLYGILRNIPFAILGGLIIALFLNLGELDTDKRFKKMGIWITVSFVCYTIVVLGSGTFSWLGAFMMPKTVAYFIIIYIGFKSTNKIFELNE